VPLSKAHLVVNAHICRDVALHDQHVNRDVLRLSPALKTVGKESRRSLSLCTAIVVFSSTRAQDSPNFTGPSRRDMLL
jgi:hypothetical protein